MLDDVVRRELDGLVDIALLLMREDTHLVLRQQEIAGVFFDIFEIQQVLARYKQWRFPTDGDNIALNVTTANSLRMPQPLMAAWRSSASPATPRMRRLRSPSAT